jgi:general secretion pathway protein D
VLVCVTSAVVRAQAPSDARILLNQKRMEIGQLVALVSKETGRTILFDEQVRGLVSLVAKRPVTEDESWEILDSALHMLGFALVPSTAGQWRIDRIAEAIGESPYATRVRPGSDRYVTALIPLEFASLQSVMNVIQPFAGSSVALVALEQSHSLIASGPESTIARLTAIADELDRVEERALRQRVLRYRSVADVEQMIQAQFDAGRFADRELELWSDERTNSLIFRGSDDAVERLIGFLEQIDQPTEGEGEIRILRVLNRDAADVAQILGGQVPSGTGSSSKRAGKSGDSKPTVPRQSTDSSSKTDGKTGTTGQTANGANAAPGDDVAPPAPSFGGAATALDLKTLLDGEDYSIVVDPPTRSLVVRASARGHRVIRELVEELDARPQLIAVDITVSQLLTPSSWALALSYQIPFGNSLDDLVGIVSSQPVAGGTTRTAPIAPGALFGRVARDAGLDFQVPDQSGNLIPIQDTAVIDAAMGRAVNEVLLQPSLVIVAGEEHEIFVGENVPIPTSNIGSLGSPNPTNSSAALLGVTVNFNRQDVGIRVNLEAQAGQEGPIVLKFDTEISAIGASAVGPVETVGPTLLKQTLSAKARLDDGETAIVGVHRERLESVIEQGAPWLSDIPFLGWLFKGRREQIPMDTRLVIAARVRRISTPAELVADTIRRRIAFDRQRTREQHLPDSGGAPYGVRVTTRSREDDAEAIARDLERKGHRTRIQRWIGVDRRELFDVYVMGFDSMSDAGDLAYHLAEDGWDADLVVFSSRH